MGRPTCKEQNILVKILSVFIIEGAIELWISLKKSNFFDIRNGLFFHWTFFVRNKFLSDIQLLDFAKK